LIRGPASFPTNASPAPLSYNTQPRYATNQRASATLLLIVIAQPPTIQPDLQALLAYTAIAPEQPAQLHAKTRVGVTFA